jgi:hypothetical protein
MTRCKGLPTKSRDPPPGTSVRPGRSRPLLRDPAADRWTWLIVACCAQLWLARPPRGGRQATLAAAQHVDEGNENGQT